MKTWIVIGAILVAIAIILGAFGSHVLKTRLSPKDFEIFNTANNYHFLNSLSIITIALLGFSLSPDIIYKPLIIIFSGTIIFSFSLYLLLFTQIRWLGAITPIGGLCLIVGWFLLAYNISKY